MNKTASPQAGWREWTGLSVLVLPTLLLSIDISVLHLAVPALTEELRPTSSELLWISDIYGFLIAGFLITMGTLGDRVGRRRILLIGGAAFAVASVLAAYAPTAELLIVARGLLGVAGATLMPSTLSLISNMFRDPVQRTRAISLWMGGFIGGMVIGPLVGGVLLEHFWWGSVFLMNVPVMVLLLVAGPLLLPEYRNPGSGRIDLVSVVLSMAAVLPVIYGLKELAAGDFGWGPVTGIAAGLALGVVFVRRQRLLADPLLDLKLFGDRKFSASLGTLMLVAMIGPGLGLLAAQYLQLVEELSPLQAGLWMLPTSATVIVGIAVTPVLARRFRPAHVIAGGLAAGVLGMVLFTQAGGAGGLAYVVIGQTMFFAGSSPLVVLGIDMVVGAAPPERSGVASALSETGQEFSAALGLAVLGSLATIVYRAGLTVPEGTPAGLADAARDTLGGAVGAAEGRPAAAELLAAAKDAFSGGLAAAGAASAVIMLAAAALALASLRHVPPIGSTAPAREAAPVSS
ncbi:MFS transporter [Nonomuraea sp. KC401]|uniref:MFS transporter n=1 Tax=unclassified Nonomuraea TaxID=2593643 RepID=UPI0010FCED31|nr:MULTISPECIES: MFS transporter [unclassified Nonomuraea]NBE99195.1 MFS transporter [Nonomuraea sp. K271]TLF56588.1 MFS transporter [Nonomuraea sp. KC401]